LENYLFQTVNNISIIDIFNFSDELIIVVTQKLRLGSSNCCSTKYIYAIMAVLALNESTVI